MNQDDIAGILDRHDEALMALPGVIGVYMGAVDPDEDPLRLCIRVMVLKVTPELRKRIPDTLEGCPVIVEESDPIRPLGS